MFLDPYFLLPAALVATLAFALRRHQLALRQWRSWLVRLERLKQRQD